MDRQNQQLGTGIRQPTTFGNPRPALNRRFYEIASKWIKRGYQALYWSIAFSFAASLILAIYTGFFVKHTNTYASDGTVFSCELTSIQGK